MDNKVHLYSFGGIVCHNVLCKQFAININNVNYLGNLKF